MPPDPNALPFMQQMPLMDVAEKLFTLRAVERARQVDQDARVPEAKQGAAAIRQVHIEPQLQQLTEAVQVWLLPACATCVPRLAMVAVVPAPTSPETVPLMA